MNTRYNCDRKNCKYHGKKKGEATCDYISITGHRRGCSIPECTKYEQGKHQNNRKHITLKGEK